MYNQVSIIRHHIYKATEYGASFHELCRRMDIKPEVLHDGEALVKYIPGDEHDFWRVAVELTGDLCLGLHLGSQRDNYNAFGMLGLLACSCKTVKEAIEIVIRYNDTLTEIFHYALSFDNNEAHFELKPHPLWEEMSIESARQAVDMSAAGWLTVMNEMSTQKITPLRVELKYNKRFEDEYHKILKVPVLFNMPANKVVFNKADLNAPLLNYDQSLFYAFSVLLNQKQKQLESRKSITEQVKYLLFTHFKGQITHIDIVASTLAMTTRTLQRKLADENTNYRNICNEFRRDLAEELLRTGKSSKTQLASLLGYADVNALSKALKPKKINSLKSA